MGEPCWATQGDAPIRKRQLLCLQAGRAIAALLVVVHHTAIFTGTGRDFVAGKLGVQFFFVLSGIVILLAHWNDPPTLGAVRSFAWKRFRRLYPIYWIVLLPQMAWIVLRPRDSHLYQRDLWTILSNLLLLHIHSTRITVTVAWTLFHEVLFYLFFALLLLNRRIGGAALALWMAASLFFFGADQTLAGFYFSPLHLVFLFGMIAAWVIRRDQTRRPLLLTVVGLTLFVAACLISTFVQQGDANDLLAGIGAAVALPGLVRLEQTGKLRIAAWLVFLGDASYSIYLCHYPILYTLSPVTLRWSNAHHVPLGLWMLALGTASVALSCLVHLGVERPLLRWMGGFRHTVAGSLGQGGAERTTTA